MSDYANYIELLAYGLPAIAIAGAVVGAWRIYKSRSKHE